MKANARRIEFRYAKIYFYSRAFLMSLFMITALAIFGQGFEIPTIWSVSFALIIIMTLLIFGISPLLTTHWLTRTRLVLRRGWYFRTIIPLNDITSIQAYDGESRLGLNLSLHSSTLFVTSSRVDLVNIKLKKPRRFIQMFGLAAKNVIFNVEEREKFLNAINERLGSFSPIETKGPDA